MVNWLEARKALLQGTPVKRKAWNHTRLVEYLPNTEEHFENVLCEYCGKRGTWMPCVADFFEDDWEILS